MDSSGKTAFVALGLLLLVGGGILLVFLLKSGEPEPIGLGTESTGLSGDPAGSASPGESGGGVLAGQGEENSPGAESATPAGKSGGSPGRPPVQAATGGILTGSVQNGRTGSPVSGALVCFEAAGGKSFKASTNEKGAYNFQGIQAQGSLQVTRKGYKPGVVRDVIVTGPRGLEVATVKLVPMVLVKGKVFNKEKKPLARAQVVLTRDFSIKIGPDLDFGKLLEKIAVSEEALAQTATGPDGSFAFYTGEIKGGEYCLRAGAKGFTTELHHALTLADGQEAKAVELVLRDAKLLKGKVVDGSGNPVPAVTVVALSEPDESSMASGVLSFDKYWTLTDKEGRFAMADLPADKYTLIVCKTGMPNSVTDKVRVPREEEVVITIKMGFALHGRVLDDRTGKPVAGARMLAMSEGGGGKGFGRTASDAEGRYAFALAAARYSVVIKKEGYAGLAEEVRGEEGDDLEKDFRLKGGSTISGKALDLDTGKPIADVRILAVGGGERAFMMGGTVKAVSGADGSFRLEGVTPHQGTTYNREGRQKTGQYVVSLLAVKEGWEQTDIKPFEIAPGSDHEGAEVFLRRAPMAKGHVVDAKGDPVAGAEVRTVSVDSTWFQTRMMVGIKPPLYKTGDDGAFSLPARSGERIYLVVSHPSYALGIHKFKKLEPGKEVTGIEVRIGVGGVIEGQVLDENGAPATGKAVQLRYMGDDDPESQFLMNLKALGNTRPDEHTDGKGKFSFARLRAGKWTVSVKAPGTASGSFKQVKVEDGATAQVRIELERPLFIEGVLLDEAGAPVAQAWVTARRADGKGTGSCRTKEDGTFRIEGIPSGLYQVSCWHKKGTVSIPGVQAGTAGMKLVLKARPGRGGGGD